MSYAGIADKTVIVTGGASGIGLATVRRLIESGARVTMVDRDSEAIDRAVQQLSSEQLLGVCADVSEPAGVEHYFAQTIERFGRVDGLYNNAGIGGAVGRIDAVESGFGDFEMVMRVNVGSVLLGIRHMLATCKRQNSPGTIVNTSSSLALNAAPNQAVYAASKAAVVSLTKSAAVESADRQIRINAVLPGPVDTPLLSVLPADVINDVIIPIVPLKRLGLADEIAAMAVWLLSDDASYATGGIFVIDGGAHAA